MTSRIGRYEIQDELGRGAFGRVYRAYDPSVKRAVAIKVLAAGLDPEIMDRFRHEAGTTGNLTHNNIVTVYEYGEHEGMPYIAMELLEGETLQKVIQSKRPLTLLEKVHIMHQVASGLAAARAKGVIHRDIKPANIMLLPNGDAKIMDFGIARVLDKDSARRTRQGDMVGTLLYMSPEQFQGFDADEITDIFAYGVVYYELLTGVHPFAARDAGIVMFRITSVEPAPLRELAPDCPESLDQIVRRALAKDREVRVRSFEEILLDSTPILHDLKCLRAAALMEGVEEMIDGGQLDVAQSRIRQVLELDAFNQNARRWRKTVQERLERQQRDTRIAAILREADQKMESRLFPEALQCYESVLQIDSAHVIARDGQQRAKASIQASRKASKLLSEARSDLLQNLLEDALEKLTKAIDADPDIPDGAALLRTVQARIANERSDSTFANAQAERQQQTARFESNFDQARGALQAGRLEDAEPLAAALVAEFPDRAAAADLLSEIREHRAARRRAEAIAELKRIAGSLFEENRFEEAARVLAPGLRDYPEDEAIRRLHGQAALHAVVERIATLRAAGQVEKALKLASRALTEFGPDEKIEALRRELELPKLLAEGRRLIAADHPEDAVTILEQALPLYASDSSITQLLADAQAILTARQEQSEIARLLQSAAAAENQGHLDQALRDLQAAIVRYPAADDLVAAASRLQAKIGEQLNRERQAHHEAIASAIEARDWSAASDRLKQARREFPQHDNDWNQPDEHIRAALERAQAYQTALGQALEARQAKRYQEAETLLHGLSAADPLDGRADAALDELAVERNWPQWLDQVLTGRRQARHLTAAGNAAASTALLDDLTKRYAPHSEELFRQAQAQEVVTYRTALDRAEDARKAGDLPQAEQILKDVLEETGPIDRRAPELLERLAKQQRYENALTTADTERAAGNHPAALQILQDVVDQGAPDGRAAAALAAIAEEGYRAFREESIHAGLSQAGQLRADGDFPGALRAVEDLLRQFPDNGELLRDRSLSLQEIAKVQARENQEGIDAAAQARAAGDYPQAMRILRELLGHNDPDNRARMALAEILPEADRQEARKLASSGDLEGAIALLDRLIRSDPENRDLKSDLDLAKNRQDAARLRGKGNLDAALFLLDKLLLRFPAHVDVQRDRNDIARDIETAKLRAYEQALRDAAQARDAGKLPAAVQLLQKLMAQGPPLDGRAQQLLTALSEQLERNRQAAEIAARREAPRPIVPETPRNSIAEPARQVGMPLPSPSQRLSDQWPILVAVVGLIAIVLWLILG